MASSCMMVAPTTLVVNPAVVSSTKSVSFNNGGLRVQGLTARRAPARGLCIRATAGGNRDPRKEDDETIVDKVKIAVNEISKKVQDAMPGGQEATTMTGKEPSKPLVGSPGRKPGAGRQGQPEHKSSTGGITQAAYEMAEKTAVTFDGVKENIMDKLQDDGRDLRSKTGDVNFGEHRNAEGVPADAVQRSNEAQSEYTRNLGSNKKN